MRTYVHMRNALYVFLFDVFNAEKFCDFGWNSHLPDNLHLLYIIASHTFYLHVHVQLF